MVHTGRGTHWNGYYGMSRDELKSLYFMNVKILYLTKDMFCGLNWPLPQFKGDTQMSVDTITARMTSVFHLYTEEVASSSYKIHLW